MGTKIFYVEIKSKELRRKLKVKKKNAREKWAYFEHNVETAQGEEIKNLFSLELEEVKGLFLDNGVSKDSFEIFEILKTGQPLVRVTHKLFQTQYFGK
jgi:hypothetical protein